jgi:ATP-dependent Lon protease
VLELIREAPFVSAMVSWIEDDDVQNPDELKKLSDSVLIALQDVVSLTGKLRDSETVLPNDLPDLPRELSFWIAAHLAGPVAKEQQNLLEITSTSDRLQREYEMLDHTRKQLAARTVIKETFSNVDQANS